MIIGVPREIKTAEARVALVPSGVAAFVSHGHRVLVECGAGIGSGIPDEAYRAAAERVAAWLRQAAGIEASVTAEDGRFEIQGQEGFQIVYQAAPADVLIGSAWTNNAVAMLDSTWPYNTGEAPAIVSGRLSATYAWPGGERGVALLTREREFRRDNHTTWGTSYGNTDGFDVRQADDAQPPHLRRRLLILASTPAGADQAVRALEQALPPAP